MPKKQLTKDDLEDYLQMYRRKISNDVRNLKKKKEPVVIEDEGLKNIVSRYKPGSEESKKRLEAIWDSNHMMI